MPSNPGPCSKRRRHPTDPSKAVLLAHHTVLELAFQQVPVCAVANKNPISLMPRRLPRISSPLERCAIANVHAPRPATTSSSYHAYHQLQCPVCQQRSKDTYTHQNQVLFVAERGAREDMSRDEGAHRAELFRGLKRGLHLMVEASRPIAVVLPCTVLPTTVAEDLAAWELGERVELCKVLWRRLRSLHFSMEAIIGGGQLRNSTADHSRALVASPMTASSREPFEAFSNRVERTMVSLQSRMEQLKTIHFGLRSQLLHEETETRSSILDDYTTVMAHVEIAASAWRASASKSLEQRMLMEQVAEQNRFSALEDKTREFLVKDEAVAWSAFMHHVRGITSVFILELVEAAICACIVKEEKIRTDRMASFLGDRELLWLRAVIGLEECGRRLILESYVASFATCDRERSAWLAERSAADIEECRVWTARRLVEDVLQHSVATDTSP
jgi:hypothetical protein